MNTRKTIGLGMAILWIVLLGAGSATAAQFLTSPIYDVNKYSSSSVPIPAGVDPADPSDSLMCWAAAVSNVLMYTGWGRDIDNDGTVELYDDLYHHFLDDFPNAGGSGSMGYESYLNHYWASEMANAGTGWGDYFHQHGPDDTIFPTIDNYLNLNYGVYLSITNDAGSLGHAITCWGFETDDQTGEYTRIAVTDSDRGTGIGTTTLQWYDLDNRNNRWYLDDYGVDVFIRRIDAFGQNPFTAVPEPGTMMLLGTGLLIFLGQRRRK